jgi:hypothetical protein
VPASTTRRRPGDVDDSDVAQGKETAGAVARRNAAAS